MNFDDNDEKKLAHFPSSPSSLVDSDDERTTTDTEIFDSVKKSSDEAAKRKAPVIADAAEAAERKKLMSEIRMMRRYKPNAAMQSVVTGAKWGVLGWLLYRVGKVLLAPKGRRK